MAICTVAHHWLIDARPACGSYHATCRNCGEEKDFPEQDPRFRFTMTKKPTPPPADNVPDTAGWLTANIRAGWCRLVSLGLTPRQ